MGLMKKGKGKGKPDVDLKALSRANFFRNISEVSDALYVGRERQFNQALKQAK